MVDALNLDKVAIVGFSMGGGPALALAAARPDRITHLVLADVGSGADDAWRIQWLARRWVDFAQRTGWDELLPDMLRSEFFKSYANRGARYRRHMGGLIRSTPLAGLRHTLSQVLGQRKSLFRMHSTLQAVKVPTLVMLGDNDMVTVRPDRIEAVVPIPELPSRRYPFLENPTGLIGAVSGRRLPEPRQPAA